LPDLKTNEDGSLTLYVQKESPGKDRESNWLPGPDVPFYLVMRLYWPKEEALTGAWKPPGGTPAKGAGGRWRRSVPRGRGGMERGRPVGGPGGAGSRVGSRRRVTWAVGGRSRRELGAELVFPGPMRETQILGWRPCRNPA